VRDRRGRRRPIEADWFVCALPAERARRLWSPEVLARSPGLESMHELQVDWMNGLQLYLRRPLPAPHGHMTFVDSPWALAGLTQAQFWPHRRFARDYGDGESVDCLSLCVSDWETPGIEQAKAAKRCTAEEVVREVLAQLKAHLNDNGEDVLTDDMVQSWHLDPAIRWSAARRRNSNSEPLLVNTVGSWDRRPGVRTGLPNLLLAGDYVRTDMDVACMESANESARAAANALLELAGSKAAPAAVHRLYDPPELEGLKRVDAELYRAGQPHALDRP
jgi:uncharacterized protein with NAD-binding domain and iron-sulfur cluster